MAAELKIGIGADNSDLNRGLQDAERRIDDFVNKVGKIGQLGQKFTAIGQQITLGVTLPLAAAGTAAYMMAADFEDAIGATTQIFKEASDAVQGWANSLPTYYGIAKKEALEYSNMMGSMLKNIGGLTDQEASKQSAKLIELAGDLTAMYGGTTADAVRALTGALKGNNTMLDNYGMAANDALVKAKALEMGLISQGSEMSLAAKQAATLALIYEQAGAATGQAAREANGASGSMRAFKTEIKNLTTELGENLLPIITPITQKLRDLIAGFRDLSPEVKQTIVTVGLAVAAIGPLLVVVGGIMQAIPTVVAGLGAFKVALVALTGPIGLVVAGIAGIIAVVVSQWDKIKPYIQGTIKWFQDLYKESALVRAGVQSIGFAFNALYQVVKGALGAIWGYIKSFGKAVLETFAGIGDVIMGAFTLSPDKIMSGFQRINRAFVTGLSEVISTTQRAGQDIFKGIFGLDKATVTGKAELTKKVEQTVVDSVTDGVTAANAKTKNGVKITLPDVEPLAQSSAGFMNNLGETFNTLEEMDNRSSDIFERMGQGVQSFVTKFSDETIRLQELTMRFNESFQALWQGAMADTISNAFSAMGEAMTSGGNVFESFGSAVLGGIANFLGQLGELMIQYGLAASVFGKLEAALLSAPDPFTKIAAGLAMVAAGATLSMLGGAIKGAISRGSGGSGSTSSAGGYSSGYSTRYSSGGVSAGGGEYTFRISGYDLIATIDRNRNRLDRLT